VRHSVVIIDDHVDLRELLALRLAMVPGLDVVGRGANGAEALDLARSLSPDLMTLDLEMPVMTGAQVIPLLRAVAPQMRILVYSGEDEPALSGGARPDAALVKGGNLRELADLAARLLAEDPRDLVTVDLGPLPVRVAVMAFDSWIGLYARVREAITTKGDVSSDLLGEVPINSSDLFFLMGVFMQFATPLVLANAAGDDEVNLRFSVRRDAGAAARRALLALGGNGTLRAFNKAWSHTPTKEAESALDLVDRKLVEQLPTS
jgi:CheY-like chemotaxis protein